MLVESGHAHHTPGAPHAPAPAPRTHTPAGLPGAPTCTHNSPSVSCVGTFVPEQHTSMSTALEHFQPHKTPPAAEALVGFSVAPAVQAIIVDCVAVVNPQLAPIVGVDAEAVISCPEDSQAACPTHSEVIAPAETRPSATCVFIVDSVSPASHVWSATIQVRAPAPLTKVEDVFPEETSAICDFMFCLTAPTCTHNKPSVSSIGTMVPEQHASMTTLLEHLKSHKMPPCTNMLSGVAGTPSVQAIVVNCITIVNPQLASIIRENLEVVMACPVDSESASPTHSKVIASFESGPFAACVFIVHCVAPAGHVRLATIQVLAATALTKVKGVFHEETMAISGAMTT